MDLFFVLSGFLVSGLLFREYQQGRSISPGRFLIRRGFKIYPQFYLLFAVTLIVTWVAGSTVKPLEVFAEAAFFQNYSAGLWAHTWSLAVEEHFYLLLALGLTMLARRGAAQSLDDPFRGLPRMIAIACSAILGLRAATWWIHPAPSDYIHMFPSHLRMDSLLAGVLLAYYSAFHAGRVRDFAERWRAWIPPVSILFLAPAAFLDQSDPWMYTIGFSSIALGFTLLLLSALNPRGKARQKPPSIAARIMARLGRVSYAFYLWHGPVLFADDRLLAQAMARGIAISIFVNLIATFAATVIVAFVTTWLAELPFLRLRDRWFPSRAARSANQPAAVAVPV